MGSDQLGAGDRAADFVADRRSSPWPSDPGHIALKPWLALLYVAVFSQWIGFFAWNAGMAMGGIARVSQVQLLQPFVTFVLAALFNGETITPQILLFAAAVVATVAISTRTRRSDRRSRRISAGDSVDSADGVRFSVLGTRSTGHQLHVDP